MVECPYCADAPDDAWVVTPDAIAVPHANPMTACHVVVAPRRHVSAFYELDVQEQRAVWALVMEIKTRIRSSLKVDGFDVGFADSEAESPNHAHIHVVPRTPGETLVLPPEIDWVDTDGL